MQTVSFRNVGPPNTPHEIKQWRRQVMDMFQFLGNPIVHKHRYSPQDEENGDARKCMACFDSEYGNVRQDCPVCFGLGYVSPDDKPGLYVNDSGRLTGTVTPTPAPKFGGFGPPFLTWVAEPDVAFDFFKINQEGVFQRIANATAVAPWYPEMSDNDLLIDVEIGPNQQVTQVLRDRYELKQSNQLTVRGWGMRQQSRREHLLQQTFQMSLLPLNHRFYNVPLDELHL